MQRLKKLFALLVGRRKSGQGLVEGGEYDAGFERERIA